MVAHGGMHRGMRLAAEQRHQAAVITLTAIREITVQDKQLAVWAQRMVIRECLPQKQLGDRV
ncbi:hypothetical protein D3C85_1217160 [compost metagenome]